jgi:hypothetical protein
MLQFTGIFRRAIMTNIARIDLTNFFLIWITLILSFLFPFELFLFSYAVLGPLHYMTEINWLEKKNYFLGSREDKVSYLIMSILIISLLAFGFLFKEFSNTDHLTALNQQFNSNFGSEPVNNIVQWTYSILFIGLFVSVIYFLTDRWLIRILLIALSILITLFFFTYPLFSIWFGLFLPTIVHVFLFTLLFMFFGAMRAKSIWGYLNVASMLAVIILIITLKVSPVSGSIGQETFNTYTSSNFQNLLLAINKSLGLVQSQTLDIYLPVIWKIQIFIAFAYTYHYLNWFSKTTVINWHQTGKQKMFVILCLWLASVGLYFLNYHIGFVALYVLSMLHVILEFPLNVSSIKGIFQGISSSMGNLVASKQPGWTNK